MDCKVKITFDANAVVRAVRRGSYKAFYRTGGYIRAAARKRVRKSKKASSPGSSPNTRRGLLRRSILFGVDKTKPSVVVGPARKFIGLAMTAHEFGIRYRGRNYPKRPLMRPTLEHTARELPKFWKDIVK